MLHRHVGWEQCYLKELPHLVKVEQRYAHLYKERLAISVWSTKFHQYLLGRLFIIMSDHKPLQHIFSENELKPALVKSNTGISLWGPTITRFNISQAKELKCRCFEAFATARVTWQCTFTWRNYILTRYFPRVTNKCSSILSMNQRTHCSQK